MNELNEFNFKVRDWYDGTIFTISAEAATVDLAKAKVRSLLAGWKNMIILSATDKKGGSYVLRSYKF